jgi:hypothetical protein
MIYLYQKIQISGFLKSLYNRKAREVNAEYAKFNLFIINSLRSLRNPDSYRDFANSAVNGFWHFMKTYSSIHK